jgi:hypothetical protein
VESVSRRGVWSDVGLGREERLKKGKAESREELVKT